MPASKQMTTATEWKSLFDAMAVWRVASERVEVAMRDAILIAESDSTITPKQQAVIDKLLAARVHAHSEAKLRFSMTSTRIIDVFAHLHCQLISAEGHKKGNK